MDSNWTFCRTFSAAGVLALDPLAEITQTMIKEAEESRGSIGHEWRRLVRMSKMAIGVYLLAWSLSCIQPSRRSEELKRLYRALSEEWEKQMQNEKQRIVP